VCYIRKLSWSPLKYEQFIFNVHVSNIEKLATKVNLIMLSVQFNILVEAAISKSNDTLFVSSHIAIIVKTQIMYVKCTHVIYLQTMGTSSASFTLLI
jgi:hypothetical protein